MDDLESDIDNAEKRANISLLEPFISYFWSHYPLLSDRYKRKLLAWLLSKNNGKGTRCEQNLKLDLEPVLAFLLKCHSNRKLVDENGQTILHILCSIYVQREYSESSLVRASADCEILLNLINAGASIIAADYNGKTPLGMVLAKNRYDMIECIPCRLINVNARNNLGETILHIIMKSYVKHNGVNLKDKSKHEEIITYFLCRGANFHIADVKGMTPIHYAAMKCYLSILEIFKSHLANLHTKTKHGDNLLILACKNITLMEDDTVTISSTIEWLLKQNYDVNYRNQAGHTALHYAAQSGHKNVIVQLIERGADVNIVGLDGATPLHSAIMSSNLENTNSLVLMYLFRQGIKADSQETVFGFRIEHLAALNRGKTIVFRREYINRRSKSGLTPLHLAAMSANTQVVRELIELGADVHCRENTYGYTPLHLASMRGQFRSLDDINVPALEEQLDMNQPNLIRHCFDRLKFRTDVETNYLPVINLLLQAGANVNAKDTRGRTPLHCAIQQSESNVVEKLLEAGADVDSLDNNGHVPLQHAMMAVTDNWQGIECLLKYGANVGDIETNIKDIYKQSKITKFTIADRLLRYVAKLECAKLRTKTFYRPQHKKPRIDNFKPTYMKEIQLMKKLKIKDDVMMYDVLHMTTKRRASLIDSLPSDYELQLGFPNYSTIISGRFREAVNRESMLESAKLACDVMMQVQWPEFCIKYVFSFLRNRDLRAIINSVWNE